MGAGKEWLLRCRFAAPSGRREKTKHEGALSGICSPTDAVTGASTCGAPSNMVLRGGAVPDLLRFRFAVPQGNGGGERTGHGREEVNSER